MSSRQHLQNGSEIPAGSAIYLAEAALRFAQRRDLILGGGFANPAWDIMLRLYLAALKDRDLEVQALVDEADRSSVTGRWLDALAKDGLVVTTSGSSPERVRLTAHGKASMDALFASAQAGTTIS